MTSQTTALDILADIAGTDFDIPNFDVSGDEYSIPSGSESALYAEITKLENSELTTGFNGTGVFDVLMASFAAHLRAEYVANRITGAEYTKAYIAMAQAALSGAVQFSLGRDQAFWNAQQAQAAAITAKVGLETAKAQLVLVESQVLVAKSQYASSTLDLALKDSQHKSSEYQLNNLLPKQLDLLKEQVEAQRAQTLNTRTDGTTAVSGTLGKQRDLYDQQITAYKRSSEQNAAKLFLDAWITRKTIDEGTLIPTTLENTSIDAVLADIKTNNDIG